METTTKINIATRGEENAKYFAQYFESLTQFSNWLNITPPKHTVKDSHNGSSSFTGSNSYAEADLLMTAKQRWDDVYEQLKSNKVELSEDIQGDNGYKVKRKPSVAGGSVNISRYLKGAPDCMNRTIRTEAEKRGKVVDLYFDPCISGGYSTQAMITYGIAVYNLIDALQIDGYAVNVFLACTNGSKNGLQVCFIKVKDSSELLEMNSMLYAIAHPSMFRRHIFAYLERSWYLQFGYGRVPSMSEFTRQQLMWGYNDNQTKSFFLPNLQNMSTAEQKMTSKQLAQMFLGKIMNQMSDYENGNREPMSGQTEFRYW